MGGKTVDMTKGSILPKMIRFALPVLLGMLFQRIYNFVDVYIVGRYLGDEALAAVSIAGGAMYLLFSIMMGLTTGVSVVVPSIMVAGMRKGDRDLCFFYLCGGCIYSDHYNCGTDRGAAASAAFADLG